MQRTGRSWFDVFVEPIADPFFVKFVTHSAAVSSSPRRYVRLLIRSNSLSPGFSCRTENVVMNREHAKGYADTIRSGDTHPERDDIFKALNTRHRKDKACVVTDLLSDRFALWILQVDRLARRLPSIPSMGFIVASPAGRTNAHRCDHAWAWFQRTDRLERCGIAASLLIIAFRDHDAGPYLRASHPA